MVSKQVNEEEIMEKQIAELHAMKEDHRKSASLIKLSEKSGGPIIPNVPPSVRSYETA